MDVITDRVCGLDVHKKSVTAAVRTPDGAGGRRSEIKTFATTSKALFELADWLVAAGVTQVAMESSGVYWKPVWRVFELYEDDFEAILVNAQHFKAVPGRKTDVKDAEWLAQLCECGLLRASFVPDRPQRELRDLVRYRRRMIEDRGREIQRIEKQLEDTGIKVTSVTAVTLGVSTRDMFEKLCAGERDPNVLADCARGRMKAKVPQLREALDGDFGEHHGHMIRHHLDHIDHLSATIDDLDTRIDQAFEPYQTQRDLLCGIDGVHKRTAEAIIAEIGVNMDQWGSAERLAKWAGICPANNESAGKRSSTRSSRGNRWLHSALTEAGQAAAHTKNTFLAARYRRIAARRGKKRAAVAVGHSILTAAYHMLATNTPYQDPGGDYYDNRRPDRIIQARRLTNQLTRLGYNVTLTPAA